MVCFFSSCCFPVTYPSTRMLVSPAVQHFAIRKPVALIHSLGFVTPVPLRVVCILYGTISFSFKKAAIKMTAYFKIHGV